MPVAIVLPPREHVSGAAVGAVAMTVVDLLRHGRLGSDATIFTGTPELVGAGLHSHPVAISRWRLGTQTGAYARKLAGLIKDGGYGLVEVHNRANLFAMLRKRLPSLPMTLTLHNDPLTIKGLKKAAERKEVLKQASAVICISEFVRQRFLQGIEGIDEVERERVVVISNALEAVTPPSLDDKQNTILFVGRMVSEKGGLLLAQALAKVLPQHPSWRACFIGAARFGNEAPTTPYESEVIEALEPIRAQVDYLNARPHAEVMVAFGRASIAVVPSLCDEAFGRTLLEAMLMGCACITSGRGGLAEVAGDAALILDVNDRHRLEQALEALIHDSGMRRRYQEVALQRSRDQFDIRGSADRLDSLRQRLLESA